MSVRIWRLDRNADDDIAGMRVPVRLRFSLNERKVAARGPPTEQSCRTLVLITATHLRPIINRLRQVET